MRWDRTAWVSAGFWAAASAIVASIAMKNTSSVWKFEWARAADVAGEYLFICAPILCAVVALNSRRVEDVSRGFSVGSPNPRAGAYRSWLKFAGFACVVHVVIMAAALAFAWRSDAATTFSVQPMIRQFALIVAASAFGAWAGARVRSIALPAVLFAFGVFVALLIPQTHLRPFLLAGSGTFDFTFQRYSWSLILLALATAVAATLLAFWSTRVSRGWVRGARLLGVVAAVGSLMLMSTDRTFDLAWVHRTPQCAEQTPKVCAPAALVASNSQVADVSRLVYSRAPSDVASLFPGQLDLVAPGTPNAAAGAVEFDTAETGDAQRLTYEVIRTLSGANLCVDSLRSQDIESQVLASGVVIGWLEHEIGFDIPGSYPSDQVTKLLAMPAAKETAVVSGLIREIKRCQGVDLGALT